MATSRQKAAAKKNVKKAQQAAREKRTIANMPKKTRTALGKQASMVARRKGDGTPHDLEKRTRKELVDTARDQGIAGRSKMGTSELVGAIRRKQG